MLIFKKNPEGFCLPALLLATLFFASPAIGQTPGGCVPAKAEAYLDVGNVRARIFNNGALFWKGNPSSYEVPKGSGLHAVFNTSIWVGGIVQGQLRVAAARYFNWQFWPGPLDDLGNPPFDCALYDQLWEITRQDLIAYAQTETPTANLLDWPWHLGAPVVDGDGVDGNYNLDGGDRPALIGDQMLWWIMNDAGNEHRLPLNPIISPPIGMEVHGSAFAFNRPRSYIDNVTFYRYMLHYKGAHAFEDAYFGYYADVDLGYYGDNYLGSDSTLHLGFIYNGDNIDEEDRYGYGEAPPAIGYTFLRSPPATDNNRDDDHDGTIDEPGEMRGMTALMTGDGDWGGVGDAEHPEDYYNYMRARWKDGQPLTLGGNGRDFSYMPTTFFFPGDPLEGAFWSERNVDGQGQANLPGYRFFHAATGPMSMQPGETQEILLAIVWSRGHDHLDSVRRLKADTKRLHEVADAILVPDVAHSIPAPEPEPVPLLGFAQNYPNPFRETTTIRYSLPQPMDVRLTVYDVLGREQATLVDERQEGGVYKASFEADDLPSGTYFYRIEMDHLSATRPMTLMR